MGSDALAQGGTQIGMGALQGFATFGPVGAAIGGGLGLFSGLFGGGDAKRIKEAASYYHKGAVEERKTAEVQSRAFEGAAKLFTVQAEADVINLGRYQRAALTDAAAAVQTTHVGLWLITGLVSLYVLAKMKG